MQDFKTINTWQRAYAFTLKVYQATFSFPEEEKFGLTSQLRRATASIPINISEGAGRISKRDFANFVQIALGSSSEVECELMLARDLGYLNDSTYISLDKELKEIRRMMYAFRKSLLTKKSNTETEKPITDN